MRRALRCALLAAAVGGAVATAATVRAVESTEAQARALEERLRAPCCRSQLLDAHESEVTRELRREIRTRLSAGETSTVLEADFVRRYGADIVAVPRDRDPRNPLSLTLFALLALTATWLVVRGLRWVRNGRSASVRTAPTESARESDALDAKLDAELRALDP